MSNQLIFALALLVSLVIVLARYWPKICRFGGKLSHLLDVLIEQQALKNESVKITSRLADLEHSKAVITLLEKQNSLKQIDKAK